MVGSIMTRSVHYSSKLAISCPEEKMAYKTHIRWVNIVFHVLRSNSYIRSTTNIEKWSRSFGVWWWRRLEDRTIRAEGSKYNSTPDSTIIGTRDSKSSNHCNMTPSTSFPWWYMTPLTCLTLSRVYTWILLMQSCILQRKLVFTSASTWSVLATIHLCIMVHLEVVSLPALIQIGV